LGLAPPVTLISPIGPAKSAATEKIGLYQVAAFTGSAIAAG
jgi:hypothetical protein